MATTVEQIDIWLGYPKETQTLEFKQAKNSYDREKLAKYCVAIANEGGGHLLLGVTDEPPRQVVGSSAFPDLIHTASEIFTSIGFRVDVEEVTHSDGRVVIFHIPARPRGTAYDFKGAYLMRSGESLVPMSETACAPSSPRAGRTGWTSRPKRDWTDRTWSSFWTPRLSSNC